jgi:hypothetical protein
MKRIFTLLAGMSIALAGTAQDSTKVEKSDTIKIGNMVIIKTDDGKKDKDDFKMYKKTYKPSNVSTSWFVVDLGLNQFRDKTDYPAAIASGYLPAGANEDYFDLRNGKSTNVNIWVFMQRLNMIKHVVNLKYGMGLELNNYRFRENIKFNDNTNPLVSLDPKYYGKNKLAADYITVPMMLNFNFTPKRKSGFGLSAGMSVGYLYSARQKVKNDQMGKEKFREDFDLRDWKVSYIGELNLGPVRLYGSYATKSMFKKTLDHTPYNVGFRIGGSSIYNN